MRRRAFLAAAMLSVVRGPFADGAEPVLRLFETPSLAPKVKAGVLPHVGRRVPDNPSVVTVFAGLDGPGRCGGDCNMLITRDRDTRLMTVYSNARLIVDDWHFKLHPDILESYQDEDGRAFTLKLRAGHKWSDGHPFTTEDFRYFWEDIANDKDLSP